MPQRLFNAFVLATVLVLAPSCELGASVTAPGDPPGQNNLPGGAVAVTATMTPAVAHAGDAVHFQVTVSATQAMTVDVSLLVAGPSGTLSYDRTMSGTAVSPDAPKTFEGTLTVDPTDPPGAYALSASVRRAGQLILHRSDLATFAVVGSSSGGGTGAAGGGSGSAGGGTGATGGGSGATGGGNASTGGGSGSSSGGGSGSSGGGGVNPLTAMSVTIGGATQALDGINTARATDQLILYTRLASQTSTPTNRWGTEVVVVSGQVVSVSDRQLTDAPAVDIPSGGYVLSGHLTSRDWLNANAVVGATVTLSGPPGASGGGSGASGGGAGGAGGAAGGGAGGGASSTAPLGYPAKAVAVYHMMWASSGAPALSTLPANVNVVNLAFAQSDPPALVGWSAQGEAAFLAQAAMLRARGVRFILSVGGQGGQVNISNRQAFVNGVMAINAKLPLDGLDWDLEGPAMSQADVVWIAQELDRLRGPAFAQTMAPNGSNVSTYLPIAVALHQQGLLDAYGQQFYDAVVSKEAANGRIDQAIAAGLPESKITVGMMVGSTSVYWTVDQCVTNVTWLKSQHPGLRGGYLWESGRAGTADWASRIGNLLMQ